MTASGWDMAQRSTVIVLGWVIVGFFGCSSEWRWPRSLGIPAGGLYYWSAKLAREERGALVVVYRYSKLLEKSA